MSMDRETLIQALEAMAEMAPWPDERDCFEDAAKKIREGPAQPLESDSQAGTFVAEAKAFGVGSGSTSADIHAGLSCAAKAPHHYQFEFDLNGSTLVATDVVREALAHMAKIARNEGWTLPEDLGAS